MNEAEQWTPHVLALAAGAEFEPGSPGRHDEPPLSATYTFTDQQLNAFVLSLQPRVLGDIVDERGRQDSKWGGPEHDDEHLPGAWCGLIQDYAGWARVMAGMDSPDKYRRRMVQVAALAVAAIESHDRRIAPLRTFVAATAGMGHAP